MFCFITTCLLMMSLVLVIIYFFLFKQKTAYEMRISDWSSDVCSSDLIPGYSKFIVDNVRAGNYDIRYRDLDSGGLSRTEPFLLEEESVQGGTQFSAMTLTLYKIQDGNMETYGLSESEF